MEDLPEAALDPTLGQQSSLNASIDRFNVEKRRSGKPLQFPGDVLDMLIVELPS